MAAKKKTAKSKKTTKPTARASKRAKVKAPRVTAAPPELKSLDSGWRSFIENSATDAPLTEVWEAPKGTPSSKSAIRKATEKKSQRTARSKAPTGKNAGARKAPTRKKAGGKAPTRKKAGAGKAPAPKKAKKK